MAKDGSEKFVCGQVLFKNQSSAFAVTRDVVSIYFPGVLEVCPKIFVEKLSKISRIRRKFVENICRKFSMTFSFFLFSKSN